MSGAPARAAATLKPLRKPTGKPTVDRHHKPFARSPLALACQSNPSKVHDCRRRYEFTPAC